MISIRVPASTTNLGPGFDCLGIALQLWNRITLEIGRPPAVDTFTLSKPAGQGESAVAKRDCLTRLPDLSLDIDDDDSDDQTAPL